MLYNWIIVLWLLKSIVLLYKLLSLTPSFTRLQRFQSILGTIWSTVINLWWPFNWKQYLIPANKGDWIDTRAAKTLLNLRGKLCWISSQTRLCDFIYTFYNHNLAVWNRLPLRRTEVLPRSDQCLLPAMTIRTTPPQPLLPSRRLVQAQ